MTHNTPTTVFFQKISYLVLVLLGALLATPISAQIPITQQCIDPASDPDGDGWGYENGMSCRVATNASQSTDTLTTNVTTAACVDTDGDGWGWDGVASCRVAAQIPAQSSVQSPAQSSDQSRECVDSDGDGWGWNGVASCLVSIQPPEQIQEPTVQAPSANTNQTPEPATIQDTVATQITTSCAATLSAGANLYNAISSTSGTICLRPGSYSLPDTLFFRSNQTLTALDRSNPPVITTSAIRTLSTTGRSNVTIDSIIIDGNGSGAREFGILVGNGSNNITLNNVVIRNTFGIGIGITGSGNVNINGGTITNIGQDTRLRQAVWTAFNSRTVTINGLTVRGRVNDVAGGDHAITCLDVNGFTVTNTRSEYAGSGAVAINNCSNITVTNNELHNGREHGVDIVNGAIGATVSGNNITGFDRSAMVFDDHDWQCAGCGDNPTEITVSNNRMAGNNLINLARCRGIAVDSQMVINPSPQRLNSDWVRITSDNQIDSDSSLFCQHIH